MHIKQIIIQGFKSYQDQTVVELFDKRQNVVVGRHGSSFMQYNLYSVMNFLICDQNKGMLCSMKALDLVLFQIMWKLFLIIQMVIFQLSMKYFLDVLLVPKKIITF